MLKHNICKKKTSLFINYKHIDDDDDDDDDFSLLNKPHYVLYIFAMRFSNNVF
jgi:hypothetical protein